MAFNDSLQQQFNRVQAGQVFSSSRGIECVNASGGELTAGRVVCKFGTQDVTGAVPVDVAVAADFTAKTLVFTIANWSSGETVQGTIRLRGRLIAIPPVPFNTDNNTSVTDLRGVVNVALDAAFTAGQSIVATDSSGAMTLAAEIAGEDFDADFTATGNITIAKTGNGAAVMDEIIVGVIPEGGATELNTSGASVVADGHCFTAIAQGQVAVALVSAGATSPANEVYVSTDASGTPGALLTSAGASRVWIDRSKIRYRYDIATTTHSPVGAVAVCEVNL